jgi:hypothetical protein
MKEGTKFIFRLIAVIAMSLLIVPWVIHWYKLYLDWILF